MKKLSVIVTTRNEAANIANCLHSFDEVKDDVELIVVDNSSTDDTKAIAAGLGAVVLNQGPERCAQRNLGWRTAGAEWVLVLDADMIVPPQTVSEIISIVEDGANPVDAYWIPETRVGSGIRVKARNFERSFYDGTWIDALRLFRRTVLEKTGGYDEKLVAAFEDWDLDIRVLDLGVKCEVLKNGLIHNEASLSLCKVLRKKAYYTRSMAQYRAKWAGHPAIKKQFSLWYRFVGVFTEEGKWKRLFQHPILAAIMYFERVSVGLVYLAASLTSKKVSRPDKLSAAAIAAVAVLAVSFGAAASSLPAKEKFKIVVLAGQSNMAGRGKIDPANNRPHPRVFVMDRSGNWVACKDPLHFDIPGSGVGPGKAFGEALADSDPSIVVGLVPCAVGGSSITVWEPGRKFYKCNVWWHPYDDMLERVKRAKKAGTLTAILWHQGESDCSEKAAADYKTLFPAFVERMRRDLDAKDVPLIVGGLHANYLSGAPGQTIAEVQRRVCEELLGPGKYIPGRNWALEGDNIHYTGASQREFAKLYFAAFREVAGKRQR